mmetsp:Transcript_20397/g.33774  ORF Transcript_20397/g.33774 Transcript_20397/m.33774 type:complete len:303 (+) Transcript_20397:119-1027(+)|eukprot:CAMPEP_0119017316 /NCGR_PEP_ID=MMETSP1176-20130426/16156_1 /TAXON_ID=265551 /ORGANISM="Synedropsis recta cf, Strain CCMP1620" /LENGTH=302 /DNA_ID=CAMNT_0006971003 /DNA_START=21 /DNA_END=929 /DNA_ORIENTATION=-
MSSPSSAEATGNHSTTSSSIEERPKQRRRLLIKEKAGILQWMDVNKKTLEETCQEFDLSISTLAKWRMRRNEIIHQANSAQGNLKSHHAPKFPQVEAKVLAWIAMIRQREAAVGGETTTTLTMTTNITNKVVEQYFHQAKREVLAQMAVVGRVDDNDELTEEEIRKKRKLERLSVSPEFVRNFMFRHGIPTADQQEEILSFSTDMSTASTANSNNSSPTPEQQTKHQRASSSTMISATNTPIGSTPSSSAWDERIRSIERQWGVNRYINPNANRKEKIEAVERQVFGKEQVGTLEQRIQALE